MPPFSNIPPKEGDSLINLLSSVVVHVTPFRYAR